MVTIIATGDRESDLFHWSAIIKQKPDIRSFPSIDASTKEGAAAFLQKLDTISLLAETTPLIVHSLEITEAMLPNILSYGYDIFIISPQGKLPKLPKEIRVVDEKIGDSYLKSAISDSLRKLSINLDRDQAVRLYIPLTIEDFMGKERLSPLRCMTLLRQIETISGSSPEEANKAFAALLGLQEGKASQWELLGQLFSTSKKKQKEYFAALTEIMSPYEIMSMGKSTLLLVMIILQGRKEGLDAASIAKKIGKHPFYVGSLLKTIDSQRISYERAEKVLARFMNLESALKSGKFEDEQFGFEVLLATL